ncbi:hypothetical protein EDC14_104816 [Hydrogenispora ethanolica]|uniref:Uncharacterized protein n=1 Tax=Hydrogenispora ethanolica TaxID=1082276 RepID=A0A4R1QUF4_HYDET|nr:hypothetical protein EDC14_104816 [Hydrogenispora ethanolica]
MMSLPAYSISEKQCGCAKLPDELLNGMGGCFKSHVIKSFETEVSLRKELKRLYHLLF